MLDDAVLELISRNDVLEFVRRGIDDYRPREDFDSMALPNGLSPDVAWNLVEWMRRAQASPIAFSSPCNGERAWYMHSGRLATALENLAWKTRSGGSLERNLLLYLGRRGVWPPMVREIACAASRDGLETDLDSLSSAMQGNAPAEGVARPVENALFVLKESRSWLALLQNGTRTVGELASFVDRGAEELAYRPVPHTGTPYGDDYTWVDGDHFAKILSTERAKGPHPIIQVLFCSEAIWMKPAFERWNNLLEFILRHMMFEAAGMPVLGYIPYSEPVRAWETARNGRDATAFPFGEAILESKFGLDVTPFFLQLVSFLEHGVEEMEQKTAAERKTFETCIAAVRADERINHRQKLLVEKLLESPSSEVNAYDYHTRAGIAASTAYADLHGLVVAGYLSSSVRDRIQTFWLEPTLEKRLCRRAP